MAKHSKCETSFVYTTQDLVNAMQDTIDTLLLNFNKPEIVTKQIVYKYILNTFKQMQLDADNLCYLDFFKKYIHDYKMLTLEDATMSQMKTIISEAPLNEEDKQIAIKLFLEQKTYDEIAEELNISEPRTIGNNKDRIRDILKLTAYRIFLKN